jgi:HAD superfamily phosphoserine phosphatase-like hydrolase
MTTLTHRQSEFVESVLRLKPAVAAFDCDGTLWSGDAGEGFFSWSLKQGMVSEEIERWARSRHVDYKDGKVSEEVMCGEMVMMYHGLREEDVQRGTDEYFELGIAPGIFPEMHELVQRLCAGGTDVWAVSSSNHWIIRSAMRHFGVARNRILAAEAAVENGVVAERLIRVPSGPGKPEALREVLASPPDYAFGNSIWDREMLAMAKHPFAINPTPELKEIARASGWRIYQPEENQARGV